MKVSMRISRGFTSPSKMAGFTLIELLVVIAIIGILASIVMPSLSTARDKALVAAAVSELNSIKTAMEILWGDTGLYPNGEVDYCRTAPFAINPNEVDLSVAAAALVGDPGGMSGWNGPYVPTAVDKWGTPYFLDEDYQCLAATEGCRGIADVGEDSNVIVSCGPNVALNGSEGCAYDNDNIVHRLCD